MRGKLHGKKYKLCNKYGNASCYQSFALYWIHLRNNFLIICRFVFFYRQKVCKKTAGSNCTVRLILVATTHHRFKVIYYNLNPQLPIINGFLHEAKIIFINTYQYNMILYNDILNYFNYRGINSAKSLKLK